MAWRATLSTEMPAIELTFDGVVTPPELFAALEATSRLVREHDQMHILADCTAMRGGHSVTNLYQLADAIVGSGLAHRIREAVILPALGEIAEKVHFWENTCANRGIQVRIFTDRAMALEWLFAKSRPESVGAGEALKSSAA